MGNNDKDEPYCLIRKYTSQEKIENYLKFYMQQNCTPKQRWNTVPQGITMIRLVTDCIHIPGDALMILTPWSPRLNLCACVWVFNKEV